MAAWSVPGVVHLREVREDLVGRRVLARHHITRRSLAVTYLSHELLTDTEFRTRFAREFARLARVRDTRIVGVHRYVEGQQGAAVVGDHVHGTSLRDLLLAHGAVGTEAALVVLSDSLRGLAAGHAAGVAHGDIKPESVVLTPSGPVRLVDFGLWTAHGRRLLARSTPFYLAPEQWSGHEATPAGDLYAATVTFFECLIGAPPFYGDRSAELSAKHEQSTPPIDAIPGPVRELVCSGLAKDPHRRPDARSLLAEVAEAASHWVGAGWEQRGRRELARLLTNQSALPEISMPDGRRGGAGSEHRRPLGLAAVVGGALVLAAGLASPPLAVILPGGSIFGSSARPPVRAFPEPAPGTSPVRAVTKGPLADRPPHTAPAGQLPVARARPGKDYPLEPSIPGPSMPGPNPQIAIGEHPDPSVYTDEAARARSAPARACAPMPMAEHEPCSPPVMKRQTPESTGIPSGMMPVQVPGSIEVPTSLQALIPILEKAKPQKDVSPPRDVQSPKNVESSKKLPRQAAPRDRGQAAPVRQTEQQPKDTAKTGGSTGEERSSR